MSAFLHRDTSGVLIASRNDARNNYIGKKNPPCTVSSYYILIIPLTFGKR